MRLEEIRRGRYWPQTPSLREILIALSATGVSVTVLLLVTPFAQWFAANLPQILFILILMVSVAVGLQIQARKAKKEKQIKALALQREQEELARRLEWKRTLPARIMKAIKEFEPSQPYPAELGYHAELQGWLKREFPYARAEVQTGSSRPDISIDQIAVEVKGPSYDVGLKSLADKCIRYLQYYDGLVIVLFEPRYTRQLYHDVVAGIERTFPGKVWFIEKQPRGFRIIDYQS